MKSGKHIALLGAGGMLGRAFRELFQREGCAFRPFDLPEFDFTRPESIPAVLEGRPSAVINCAAFTDVDGAESNEPLANSINAAGVGILADACTAATVPLLHFSTDYVFSGAGDSPYPAETPRNSSPVNAYGRSKLLGEQFIERAGGLHLIVRTSWLYAPWAKNFVRTIAGAAKTKPELKVVNDQRGRPTSAEHLAMSSLELLRRGKRGIWHITDGGECTWFGFASEIVRQTGSPCLVKPCSTAEFPRPAKRPAYSVLDISKTERELGTMPGWEASVKGVVARLDLTM